MEVHHHSSPAPGGTHISSKKWTHYLWEFVMLFLAVFCGFLAENIREHQVERKREKEYILSMIEDLKEDTTSFNSVIISNSRACTEIDSLITFLKAENRNELAKKIYMKARTIPLFDENLACQNKTFEQLKSSGGLRLIHNMTIQNKIGSYYQIDKIIESGSTQMQYQNRRDLFLSFEELFDAAVLQEIMKSFGGQQLNIPDNHFRLLSNDPKIINRFCTRYHVIYSTKKVVSNQAKRFINQATALITYLQNEYHLD